MTTITIGTPVREEVVVDGTLGVVHVRAAADLETLELPADLPAPCWVVLARPVDGGGVALEVADVDGAPAAVLTWTARAGKHPQAVRGATAWPVRTGGPLRLLLRRVERAAAAPAPATGAPRPPRVTGDVASAEGPGVALDPCGAEVGVEGLLHLFEDVPPPPGLDPDAVVAAVVARPVAGERPGGRALRSLGARAIPGGVRCAVALPVDDGPPLWGPREGVPTLLAFPRSADALAVEWLLQLEAP